MKNLIIFPVVAVTLALSGCSFDGEDDLDDWMKQEAQKVVSHIEPVPKVKSYIPFQYLAFDLIDPFSTAKLQTARTGSTKPKVISDWRKEPLEDFDLDKITMSGLLQNKKGTWAIVNTPDGKSYTVKKGGHIGRNFGVITDIGEVGITIKELVEDSNGDWSERQASLNLIELEQK